MAVLSPVKYRKTYESAVEMADNREDAKIKTNNFDGQALIFAGGKDEMWQGDTAAKEIGESLGDKAKVMIYDNAGHIFGLPPHIDGMAIGGTEKANAVAKEKSNKILFQFLEEHVAK